MKFEQIKPISKVNAELVFKSGVDNDIVEVLIRLAYHHNDWRWVQSKCLHYVENDNDSLKQTAILCLGHLARIHKQLDIEIVMPIVDRLKSQSNLQGRIEDFLDDVSIYINNTNKSDS